MYVKTITRLNEKESKFRVVTFITQIGAEVLEVHNGLLFRSEDEIYRTLIVLARQILLMSVICSTTENKSLTNPSMSTQWHCELWQPRANLVF